MQYTRRTLLLILCLGFSPTASTGADSDDALRILVSRANVVVLGEIQDVHRGIAREAASHFSCDCTIKVTETLKGPAPKSELIRAEIDILADHPAAPKKGDKRVIFLTVDRLDAPTIYATNDLNFCVQPASIAHDVRRITQTHRQLQP